MVLGLLYLVDLRFWGLVSLGLCFGDFVFLVFLIGMLGFVFAGIFCSCVCVVMGYFCGVSVRLGLLCFAFALV